MKRLAALPLLAALALSGCTSTESQKDHYDTFGLKITTSTDLSAEDNALLDQGAKKINIVNEQLPYTVQVTDSDGSSKNGSFVQKKHVRITFDTRSLQNCLDTDKPPTSQKLEDHIRPGDNGKPDCILFLSVKTAPSADTEYGHGDEALGVPDLPSGRSVINFDAMNGDYVGLVVQMGSGKSTYVNALTGELINSEPFGLTARELHPQLIPGLTAEQNQELSATTPQYVNGSYSVTLGKPVTTPSTEGRSVLKVPVTMHLATNQCSDDSSDCYRILTITTDASKTPTAKVTHNQSNEDINLPEDFTGTITVDSPNFEEAHLVLADPNREQTTINLLTGAIEP